MAAFPCLALGVLSPERQCHLSRLSHCPVAALPLVQQHAEPKPGPIKTQAAKATWLLKEHIRLGFSAFAGRDSHL